ncbi:MAG: type VI secretion system tip protein VgrG [Rhodobacteraceae bacterium]|nr:type VI secretion system tip protein VgrG [Paracoccaceae bacterium]
MMDGATHLVTVELVVSGQVLGPETEVVSLEVRRAHDRIPRARLELSDGDAARQDFTLSASDTFAPGTEVEVRASHDLRPGTLFKGVVMGHRVTLRPGIGTRLVLDLADAAIAMTQARRSRHFLDSSDSDVAEDIIAAYSTLRADVDATDVVHPQIVQHQMTDWDFLVMRAEAAGRQVTVLDGTVRIGLPSAGGVAVARAEFGRNVYAADMGLDAEPAIEGADLLAWSPADQDVARSSSDDDARVMPGNSAGARLAGTAQRAGLHHAGALDLAELDGLALGRVARSRRAGMRGTVEIDGAVELVPGALVDLAGFGRRFDGQGEIATTCHRIRRGSWTCEIGLGRDPRPHAERFPSAPAPAALGAMAPVSGLQIGVVLALEGDPAGEDRLQIRLPLLGADAAGDLWARQALLDAGDGRGTAFRPEINDEVVVGFLDDDPRHPVILGALHSSAKPSPLPGSDDNHEKAIVTRSGMRLAFDDDKIAARLETPAGLRLSLDEDAGEAVLEDDNGNRITLDASGITIATDGVLTLSAKRDLSLEGVNLDISANAQVKITGSAGAELSSGGVSVLKGSLVQIN